MEQWKKEIFLIAMEARMVSEKQEHQVSGTPVQTIEEMVNSYPKLTEDEKTFFINTLKAKYPQT